MEINETLSSMLEKFKMGESVPADLDIDNIGDISGLFCEATNIVIFVIAYPVFVILQVWLIVAQARKVCRLKLQFRQYTNEWEPCKTAKNKSR
jgi:hypothetical protein